MKRRLLGRMVRRERRHSMTLPPMRDPLNAGRRQGPNVLEETPDSAVLNSVSVAVDIHVTYSALASSTGASAQDRGGLLLGHASAVRPVTDHGVERVGDSGDPGHQRDRLAGQAVRV